MDLHQSVPPPYNNLYQSAPPNPLVPLVPLQRSQSLQYGPGTVPSNYHPLNAPQPRQPDHRFAQQHYIPQQRQLQASASNHVANAFAPHPSQSHHVQRVVHHPPPHLIPHPQHPPVQHQQHQQQYNLPVHHHAVPIQQPIAAAQIQHVDNQLQSDVSTQPEQQQYEHKLDAHLEGLRLIPDPPELETWRQRLFDVDDMIVVSEEE
jgi:glutathione S-transferase